MAFQNQKCCVEIEVCEKVKNAEKSWSASSTLPSPSQCCRMVQYFVFRTKSECNRFQIAARDSNQRKANFLRWVSRPNGNVVQAFKFCEADMSVNYCLSCPICPCRGAYNCPWLRASSVTTSPPGQLYDLYP